MVLSSIIVLWYMLDAKCHHSSIYWCFYQRPSIFLQETDKSLQCCSGYIPSVSQDDCSPPNCNPKPSSKNRIKQDWKSSRSGVVLVPNAIYLSSLTKKHLDMHVWLLILLGQGGGCTFFKCPFFHEKRGLKVQNFVTFPNSLWTFRKSNKFFFGFSQCFGVI